VKPLNILMTAGSRRVPLVHAFRNALRTTAAGGRIIVTDVNPLSPAVHVADRAYRVPMADDPGYLTELLAICEAERIRLVVPTIDDELPIIAAGRAQFAALGAITACSVEPTSTLCNDKFATCRHLREAGVRAVQTWLPAELPSNLKFPLFIKPRGGRGAVGAFPLRSKRELDFFLGYVHDPVVQEYLDGPEFTIDVLCDFDGQPLSIVPRERVVIRSGVMDRGRTVKNAQLIELARLACLAIPFAGPLNIQCRMKDGEPVIFEINPRFSGGIPLTIESGADFPRMLVRLALGGRVEASIGVFREDLWMTSFESSFFLHATEIEMPTLERRISEVA
jgi:carbamoyl-phosphate synthase large subunit